MKKRSSFWGGTKRTEHCVKRADCYRTANDHHYLRIYSRVSECAEVLGNGYWFFNSIIWSAHSRRSFIIHRPKQLIAVSSLCVLKMAPWKNWIKERLRQDISLWWKWKYRGSCSFTDEGLSVIIISILWGIPRNLIYAWSAWSLLYGTIKR